MIRTEHAFARSVSVGFLGRSGDQRVELLHGEHLVRMHRRLIGESLDSLSLATRSASVKLPTVSTGPQWHNPSMTLDSCAFDRW